MQKVEALRNPEAFEDEDESGTPDRSWLQASSEIYGDLAAADVKAGERIKRVSIFDIYPDLSQPRRTVPSRPSSPPPATSPCR